MEVDSLLCLYSGSMLTSVTALKFDYTGQNPGVRIAYRVSANRSCVGA